MPFEIEHSFFFFFFGDPDCSTSLSSIPSSPTLHFLGGWRARLRGTLGVVGVLGERGVIWQSTCDNPEDTTSARLSILEATLQESRWAETPRHQAEEMGWGGAGCVGVGWMTINVDARCHPEADWCNAVARFFMSCGGEKQGCSHFCKPLTRRTITSLLFGHKTLQSN